MRAAFLLGIPRLCPARCAARTAESKKRTDPKVRPPVMAFGRASTRKTRLIAHDVPAEDGLRADLPKGQYQ